jgi:hypothetical protein
MQTKLVISTNGSTLFLFHFKNLTVLYLWYLCKLNSHILLYFDLYTTFFLPFYFILFQYDSLFATLQYVSSTITWLLCNELLN